MADAGDVDDRLLAGPVETGPGDGAAPTTVRAMPPQTSRTAAGSTRRWVTTRHVATWGVTTSRSTTVAAIGGATAGPATARSSTQPTGSVDLVRPHVGHGPRRTPREDAGNEAAPAGPGPPWDTAAMLRRRLLLVPATVLLAACTSNHEANPNDRPPAPHTSIATAMPDPAPAGSDVSSPDPSSSALSTRAGLVQRAADVSRPARRDGTGGGRRRRRCRDRRAVRRDRPVLRGGAPRRRHVRRLVRLAGWLDRRPGGRRPGHGAGRRGQHRDRPGLDHGQPLGGHGGRRRASSTARSTSASRSARRTPSSASRSVPWRHGSPARTRRCPARSPPPSAPTPAPP